MGKFLAAMLLSAAVGAAAQAEEPRGSAGAKSISSRTASEPARLTSGQRKYNSIFPINTPETVLEPLLAEVGVWDGDVELYVGDPAKQPIRKKAVQTNRLVSKGHYMINEMRYVDGSYEGTGMWGWDAYHNRYTGVWMDGDHYLVRNDVGYYNPDTHTLRWESDTLQEDGVTTRFRITQVFHGDTRTFQMDRMDAKSGEFKKLIFMTFKKRGAEATTGKYCAGKPSPLAARY